MKTLFAPLLTALAAFKSAQAQGPMPGLAPAGVQNTSFNASYPNPSPDQIQSLLQNSGLDEATQTALKNTLDFERSNWAGSSVNSDPFYTQVPANASDAEPGSVLKVETFTNTTLYNLPPNTALSRFLFQTETINGTAVPNSAFVLWPWSPKKFPNVTGVPVVVWAHGTSGFVGECGPSHFRDLFYQYGAPYSLALQGYAVVAPDLAGLGIDRTVNGSLISHNYFLNPAGANDMFYSVQAAQTAFPILSENFVIMGHSEGGGVAWGAAQRQAEKPVKGYLGTVAASPTTSYLYETLGPVLPMFVAQTLGSIFPGFELTEWLSELGAKYITLLRQLNACLATFGELTGTAAPPQLVNPAFNATWQYAAWMELAATGNGHCAQGPMLVLQGAADMNVNPNTTRKAVDTTCARNAAKAQIDLRLYDGVSHIPVMYASQRDWLDWIDDRFAGKPVNASCSESMPKPLLQVPQYQKELTYFLEYPQYAYESGL